MAASTDTTAQASPMFLRDVLRDLRALHDSPRDLWLIFAIKFLESVAFFIVLNLLAVYLRADLHYADIPAGALFGYWSMTISVLTFFSGFVADTLGIRRSMLLGVLSCAVGRILLAFSSSRLFAVGGLFVMTWGVASMIPTMTAAVRRYTRKETVSFGFSLFYVTMNVGAFVAPIAVAYFRRAFRTPQVFSVLGFHLAMTSSQLVFAIGAIATLLSLGLVLMLGEDTPAADVDVPSPEALPVQRPSALQVVREVIVERDFWRFMLFISLLVLVKLVFQHAHQTWPTYTLRVFGEGFPFGYWWSINPMMIICLTPVVTTLTRNLSAFRCIVAGSLVIGLSVFFMAVSTTVPASVLFIVTLSLGETLMGPRIYEYTALIAPKGREASYMGLSSVPMFAAKPVVGFLSGYLLANYCPATGPRHPGTMWAVIGLTTLAGPLLIYALRGVIAPHRAVGVPVAA